MVLLRLNHVSNQQLGPHLHLGFARVNAFMHMLDKGTSHGIGKGCPSIDTQEKLTGSTGATTDVVPQAIRHDMIPARLHHSCQPESRTHVQSSPHPEDSLGAFGTKLIRLSMAQGELTLLDTCLLNALTWLSCSVSPQCHGALIQPTYSHNCLERTARGKQSNDDTNQLGWLAKSFSHCTRPSSEGPATHGTTRALSLALIDTPTSSTRRMGAQLP